MMWYVLFFLFKQNTSYDVRISDWSSDVCSSDLDLVNNGIYPADKVRREVAITVFFRFTANGISALAVQMHDNEINLLDWCCLPRGDETALLNEMSIQEQHHYRRVNPELRRSEEHTSELQSLMRISYAVFCLKKKNHNTNIK